MTYLVGEPLDFAADSLAGFVAAHSDLVQAVHGGVVRADASPQGEVAVVVGGGSGHYPAFAGWVGPGMAHAAVCGNIFSSPSDSQVVSVSRAADNGGGVLLLFGNYAGDCLQFGKGADVLNADGIDTRIETITDDVASRPVEQLQERRGIAGDFIVVKVAGAAAAAGYDLDAVVEATRRANAATKTLGIAFDAPTLPGADAPLFTVPEGHYELGLGVHGEPGLSSHPLNGVDDIAKTLVEGVLAEKPADARRVSVLVNGLGCTKYEEMFVLYGRVARLLEAAGLEIVAPIVDEQVTSLDMAGVSLSVCFLDDELEKLLLAPALTPAFTRGAVEHSGPRREVAAQAGAELTSGSPDSAAQGARLAEVMDLIARTAVADADFLGKLDSIAGDGDHGQGMVLGSRAAAKAAAAAAEAGVGAATVMRQAGLAWAEGAGGTSGALWGRALEAVGAGLSDEAAADAATVLAAVRAGAESVAASGGAVPGDKTMVDATTPFAVALSEAGDDLPGAFAAAAKAATEGAEATKDLVARKGRATTHGDASLGHPDPGAVSFARHMTRIAEYLAEQG
ncbi:dihydroxyacetone kinase family protein [Propionibacterium australiense]|uniref:Glycerone kinase n=1 Tax=Propionibacterium australiense TaxID=119981 RepID=A0A383S7D8_9ACTN|nr:dihydroxyacetone kinase family protein [Propionibacterium australiense]RLP08968.1 DAK2 domain-containing protein [Propionibacterium australiense]SYZ33472.1 glycerone kinase [Propionibacterium australiense]VEH91775.1 PTS-dependent dihydroxyacetone kinase, dihydroxyacetone-binding subunit dhaK [Propionibacterium australiense]